MLIYVKYEDTENEYTIPLLKLLEKLKLKVTEEELTTAIVQIVGAE